MDLQPAGGHTRHLGSLMEDMRFAMVTTRNTNNHLHAWPMTVQNKHYDEGKLWFFVSRSSQAISELQASPNIGISFMDKGCDKYVSLSAVARVVDDRTKVSELWSRMDEAWFKGGVDDPDLVLVEAGIVHGHYWDVQESKLTQLVLLAKAAMTNERPHIGESGTVEI